MSKEVLKQLEQVTLNMSLPVLVLLLGRIHNRLQKDDELVDAADHVREALSLLFDKQDTGSETPGRPN